MKPIVLNFLLFPLLSFVAVRAHSQEVTQLSAEPKTATTFAGERTRDILTNEITGILNDTGSVEFSNCLKVWEESSLDGDSETKAFAPGVGLVHDEGRLLLTQRFVI